MKMNSNNNFSWGKAICLSIAWNIAGVICYVLLAYALSNLQSKFDGPDILMLLLLLIPILITGVAYFIHKSDQVLFLTFFIGFPIYILLALLFLTGTLATGFV